MGETKVIQSKESLLETLSVEVKQYEGIAKKVKILDYLTHTPNYYLKKYIKLLRKSEYHYNLRNNPFHMIMYIYTRRKKNDLGTKLGIEIFENSFDSGLRIYHAGNIVVNREAIIGKNCKLHGDNCIGNSGFSTKSPRIGDNVRLGVGAKVIGDVIIANNITVAAGAVVVDSFEEEGITIGGIPAKKLK